MAGLSAWCVSPKQTTAHDSSPTVYCYNGVLLFEAVDDLNSAYDLLTFITETDTAFAPAFDKLFVYGIGLGADSIAVAMLEKAIELDNTNFWYKFKLANYYAAKNRITEAAAIYEDLANQDTKRHKELLYPLVTWYTQLADYPKAISALDRLEMQTGEVTREDFLTRMRIYSLSGQSDRIKTELLQKVEENPDEALYKECLAYFYFGEGDYDEAVQLYDDVLKVNPYDADINFSRLSALKLSDSIKFYSETERILADKVYPDDLRVNIMLKLIIQDKELAEDTDAVTGYFDKAFSGAESGEFDLLLLQVAYLEMVNDTSQVISVYNEILQHEPSNAAANYNLLRYYASRNDVEGLFATTTNAVKYFPEELIFHFYLSLCYLDKGDYDTALQVCETAVAYINELSPKKVASQLYSIIGDVRHERGEMNESFQAYEEALKLDADNVSVLNNYAYFLAISDGDLDKAEGMISRALEITPDDPMMLDTYAWVLFKQGNYVFAKIHINKALSLYKNPSSEILEHAGDIYYKCGDHDQAVEFWKQAEELGEGSNLLKTKIRKRKYKE